MNKAEHLAWAKQRALEYVEHGELRYAVASFMSDLTKHEETRYLVQLAYEGYLEIARGPEAVRRFIHGFNV